MGEPATVPGRVGGGRNPQTHSRGVGTWVWCLGSRLPSVMAPNLKPKGKKTNLEKKVCLESRWCKGCWRGVPRVPAPCEADQQPLNVRQPEKASTRVSETATSGKRGTGDSSPLCCRPASIPHTQMLERQGSGVRKIEIFYFLVPSLKSIYRKGEQV